MQIFVQLNDNKSIKAFSTTQQNGYQAATIDDAMANFLAEDFNLMWVDENSLVHTDNVPATKFQLEEADRKKAMDQELQTMQSKLDEANKANAQLDAKIKSVNTTIGLVQIQFAKEVAALNEVAAKTRAAINSAAKPAESAQPVQSSKPASSAPAQPAASQKPAESKAAEQPAKPAEPAQSAQPTKPASSESVKPAVSNKPAESSVSSSQPAQAAKPADEQHK